MLETTIVGSLPKPAWLADPNTLRASWRLDGDELTEAMDDAVRLAIDDQVACGLDVVAEGELRRQHYIWGFLQGLSGFDTVNLGDKLARGGRYGEHTAVARLLGEARRPAQGVFVEQVRYARKLTDKPLKVTLPGPMTMADSVGDEYYRSGDRSLAMHFAWMINAEARALADAGADIIQFDEPCFNIYTDRVAEWGIEALENCMRNVTAKKGVHICYGYGVPGVLKWKTQNQDWGHYAITLPQLAKSSVDIVSVECAASGVDVSVLQTLQGKTVMLGVIDVGTEEVETPETVADRIRKALPYVKPENLMPTTDCGLVPRSRTASLGKMRALAEGAAIVRKELGA